MKRLDQMVAWLVLLLGLHAAAIAVRSFVRGAPPWHDGFFMLSSCLLLLGCGAFSLLRIRYGTVAPGLRPAAAVAAVAVAAQMLSANIAAGEAAPATVVAAILVTSAVMAFRSG